MDYAGGLVVHAGGVSSLVAVAMLGPRDGFPKEAIAAAQPGHDHDGRGPAVGRLVRLQRRLGARGGRGGGCPGRHAPPAATAGLSGR